MGFSGSGDNNRKKFTGYQRDTESGLDYANARYYGNTQGRFTSPDPFSGSAIIADPQTFNRYQYCRDNPVNSTDPTGMAPAMGSLINMNRADGSDYGWSSKSHGSWSDNVAEDEAAWEQRVNDTFAAVAANEALSSGNEDLAQSIVNGNSSLEALDAAGNDRTGQFVQQRAMGQSEPEPESNTPSLQMQDKEFALLFSDCDAIARGSDTRTGASGLGDHFHTGDGVQHSVHIYGDESGNKIVGVFVPAGFNKVVYEGGENNQVRATNAITGEVLVFAHVAGVSSQTDVDRNLNSGRTNSRGSRYLGQIGGPGGEGDGYRHSHVALYTSAVGRQSILNQVNNATYRGTGRITDFSGYGSLVGLLRR